MYAVICLEDGSPMSVHGPFGSARAANHFAAPLKKAGIEAMVLLLIAPPKPSPRENLKSPVSARVVPGPPGFSCEDVYPDA